ncbi:MAG: TonB-dependent receptor [Opitutus sp.]|nr:TonB-dependent receptor [Opitutus sp.]
MKTTKKIPLTLRRVVALQSTLLILAASYSWAQVAPASAPSAATLAKYDTNKNGRLDANEVAAMEADQKKAVPVVTTPGGSADGETVHLSPFEVVSDTKGYYAANTMSGTRFNSKLEDLASSITVMTKEQMSDFAMLDINDIFLYTASAEGTGTYTDFTVDRNGSVSENVSLNPTGANRVRGIGSANVSLSNFETMGRTPIDPLAIDSVEISRGPNANVFGLGNPSGTANMVAASANLTRDRSQLAIRGDALGGYRSSLDLNRVLIKGVLGFRVSGSFQHDAYVRKPSGQNTVRYNGMVKYQPFKNTTITTSYRYYHQNGNRPNYSPPRDSISYWIANGRPTWDPVAQVIHVNGTTIGAGGVGTTTAITADTTIPDYFNRSFTGSGRFYAYVGLGGLEYLGPGGSTLNTNPGSGSGTLRLMSVSAGSGIASGRFTNQPLFTTTPTVVSKSMYDWSEVNLAAINRYLDRSITGNVQLDQIFFNTPRQMLAFQGGWMREDSKRYSRVTVGELNANGQSGQLLIDPNEKKLDGTTNTFFLRPYIGIDQPFTLWQPRRWDAYRGQLGYKLDLTQEKNALHWLGLHQLSGYDEYKYRVNRSYSYKDGITDAHSWIPAGASRVNQGAISGGTGAAANITRGYWRYYLGDANGNNVDYAPQDFSYGTYNFRYGNPTTGFVSEPTAITQAATTDRAGAGNNSLTIIKTIGGILQSHFWDDRIITTFGRRQDRQLVRQGSAPQRLNADGISFDYGSIDHWAPAYRSNRFGKTEQKGGVLKPFRGWPQIDQMANGAGPGRYLGQLLRGLSLTYNESNSFTPADPRYNLYFQELPNPHGEGKDKGFALNLFDNRLVVRFNSWETAQIAARNGDAGTIAQRITRIDMASTAAFLLQTQSYAWVADDPAHATWTVSQIQTEVGRQMGVPWATQTQIIDYFNAGLLSSPNDITGKGKELEINFNPTNYWTVAASVTDTKSITSNVSKEVAQWISERMPIWTTIQDPRGVDHLWGTADDRNVPWWTTSYGGSQTAAQNYQSFVGSPFNVVQQSEGAANPQIRRYAFRVSSNVKLSGLVEHKLLKNFEVGGALRWDDKAAIGYFGKQTPPATITDLDRNRPIYDKAQTYFDFNVRYRMRLWANKVATTIQLNARNLTESGHLQPIGAYPDGTPHTFRIVDPRQFILTATFDL